MLTTLQISLTEKRSDCYISRCSVSNYLYLVVLDKFYIKKSGILNIAFRGSTN